MLIIHGAWGGPSSTLWNGPRIRWSAPADGLKLLWYDRRCAGLSEYDAKPFTLDNLANDAVDLLDYLGIERTAVIATSAGGPIGLRLALDHPERVESLVLLNTGASLMSLSPSGIDLDDPFVADRLATVAKRLALLELLDSKGVEDAVEASVEEWRSPPVGQVADPILDAVRENRRRALRRLSRSELTRLTRGALLNMQAQRGLDLTTEIAEIRAPTLILHGDVDTTVPLAFGRALASAMPHAELLVLDGEGHGLIVSPVAQREVVEWLRSVSSRDGQH